MAVQGAKVAFVSISATDFANLADKDENTVYFVRDDSTVNTVYLGEERYGSTGDYPDGDNVPFGTSE